MKVLNLKKYLENAGVPESLYNVFSGDYYPQMWFPVDGYELKVPVTWNIIPSFK